MDNTFDKKFYSQAELIAGIDETGVSDIAGPLVAACVILPKIDVDKHNLKIFEISDSKKIPEKYRESHATIIYNIAIAIGVGEVSAFECSVLGKEMATKLAMSRALGSCKNVQTKEFITPDLLLIDGDIELETPCKYEKIIKGDEKSLSIAAASIIAKVYRDQIMISLHEEYPQYDWVNNKGYPCENHFKGIDQVGYLQNIHRIGFWPFKKSQLENQKRTVNFWNIRRKLWQVSTKKKILEDGEYRCKKLEKSKNQLLKQLENLKTLSEPPTQESLPTQ
jgi:ribonuclease HII